MLERIVVPVEPSSHDSAVEMTSPSNTSAEQRVVLGRVRPGMRASEDRSRRFARKLVESEASIFAGTQHRLPLLDERTDEWAQLVQRRTVPLHMLL